ncbi:MAG: OmpH family outer membrane protein [Candidatus Eremiobacteraeota bacterium]|nr:OmpH family outer membrane protein [Candidatus Eremiobacteraeota bacterium]
MKSLLRFVLMGLSVMLLAGCQPAQTKITVGKIDTATLLQSDPEYQDLATKYLREQTEVKRDFLESLRKAQSDSQKTTAKNKYGEAQKALDKKWSDKTREFLETRHSAIRGSVEEIAKAKNIDMVLIDSKMYPTVEWGAIDITQDVQLKLTQKK